VIFCLEEYRKELNINGEEAIEVFENYNVFKFLEEYYEVLHTQSMKYIIDEIKEFIRQRK
jgi:hypothetical protein